MKDFIETSVGSSSAADKIDRFNYLETNEANVEKITVLDVMNATSSNDAVAKLVKIWENKNAQRAVRGAALSTMALSLAACGGDSNGTAPVTPVAPVTPAAQTFNLTSTVDNVVGGAGDDTINAVRINEGGVANVQTFGATDTVDGGNGTDVLRIELAAATTPLSIVNVETITLTSVGAFTHNFANVAGMTTFNVIGNTGATQIDNLAAIATINITANTQNLTIDYVAAAVAGAGTTQAVALNTVTGGTLALDAGIETVSIASNGGAANTLTALTATGATSLTLTGAQDLTITNTLGTTITTVDGSAATGDLAIAQTGAQVSNITTGSGDDVIDLSGGFVDRTTTATADTVNAGAGADVLVLASAEVAAITTAAEFAGVTNIETVRIDTETTASLNLAVLTGVTTIEFDAAAAGSVRATGLTYTMRSGQEVQFDTADTGTETMTFTIAGVATSDVLNIDINGVDMGDGAITYNGVETVNIATTGTSLLDGAHVMTATAATETMNVTGTGSFTIGALTADVLNTAGMDADGTFVMGAAQTAIQITGGAADETFTGSGAADIISAGAGTDVITGGAGADTLTGGAGADTFHLAGGDTVTDFTAGVGGDVFDVSSSGNADYVAANNRVILVAENSTGAQALVDGDILLITVATAADYDTAAEIETLFGAGREFAALDGDAGADVEEFTIFITAADTGNTVVFDITNTDDAAADLTAGADAVTLVATLTGFGAADLSALTEAANFVA